MILTFPDIAHLLFLGYGHFVCHVFLCVMMAGYCLEHCKHSNMMICEKNYNINDPGSKLGYGVISRLRSIS